MQKTTIDIVIDEGNTLTKIAVFRNEKLLKTYKFTNFTEKEWKSLTSKYDGQQSVIFASVTGKNYKFLTHAFQFFSFNPDLKLPFKIKYKTPETLGVDRIANVAGALSVHSPPFLVIDIGSCITYDLVDKNGNFLGGAISPGIHQRFRSMHDFTGKLPLVVPKKKDFVWLGENTGEAMTSGVLGGIKSEIERYVSEYSKKHNGLTIFLTGGDMSFFDFDIKNPIFAHAHLTMLGLHKILKLNAQV